MRVFAVVLIAATLAWDGAASAEESEASKAAQWSVSYVADVTGVIAGGLTQRGRVLDNLDVVLDLDLEQLAGWRGANAHIDVLNNSGAMPNDDAGTLQGVDNIEVSSQNLRLFEAWVETTWDRSSLRLGLYDLNSEFYANDSAGYLIAPAFGIGSEIAATGPNGPSIFPSTALAARFYTAFDNGLFIRAAALNAHAGVVGDPDGVDTSFDEGALVIGEAGVEAARKFVLGAWAYTQKQDDIREVDGAGAPQERHAHGGYALLEHALLNQDKTRATTAFLRAGFSDGDTTPFAGGWQAGVLVERVFAARPDSVLSVGVNQGVISDGHRRNQVDAGARMGESEVQVEITYSDALAPFLRLQPDLQWIRNPGGDRSVDDAIIAALRVSVEL